jgi:hypothetical protein
VSIGKKIPLAYKVYEPTYPDFVIKYWKILVVSISVCIPYLEIWNKEIIFMVTTIILWYIEIGNRWNRGNNNNSFPVPANNPTDCLIVSVYLYTQSSWHSYTPVSWSIIIEKIKLLLSPHTPLLLLQFFSLYFTYWYIKLSNSMPYTTINTSKYI